MSIKPRTRVPDLDLSTLDGGRFNLGAQHSREFTLLLFYRGLHCPICKTYVRDLDRKLDEFDKRGVGVVAISADSRERAEQSKQDWGIERLAIAYGLSIEAARRWGLYISTSIKESEPPLFSEPGLFLIHPNATLYCASIQTMPFARPHFTDVLQAIDFIVERNYPARGEA
jgi:peroxiredoxin